MAEKSYDIYAYGEKVKGTLDDAHSIRCDVEDISAKNTNGAMNELSGKINATNGNIERIDGEIDGITESLNNIGKVYNMTIQNKTISSATTDYSLGSITLEKGTYVFDVNYCPKYNDNSTNWCMLKLGNRISQNRLLWYQYNFSGVLVLNETKTIELLAQCSIATNAVFNVSNCTFYKIS